MYVNLTGKYSNKSSIFVHHFSLKFFKEDISSSICRQIWYFYFNNHRYYIYIFYVNCYPFLAHLARGWLSFYHHLASVVVKFLHFYLLQFVGYRLLVFIVTFVTTRRYTNWLVKSWSWVIWSQEHSTVILNHFDTQTLQPNGTKLRCGDPKKTFKFFKWQMMLNPTPTSWVMSIGRTLKGWTGWGF